MVLRFESNKTILGLEIYYRCFRQGLERASMPRPAAVRSKRSASAVKYERASRQPASCSRCQGSGCPLQLRNIMHFFDRHYVMVRCGVCLLCCWWLLLLLLGQNAFELPPQLHSLRNAKLVRTTGGVLGPNPLSEIRGSIWWGLRVLFGCVVRA